MSTRRVVRGQRAGRAGRAPDFDLVAEELLDLFTRNPALAQDLRRLGRAVDDRRLDTHHARPAVEDLFDVRAELDRDGGGRRRAHVTEPVGRWCSKPTVERAEQLEREWMCGHSQPNGVQTTG